MQDKEYAHSLGLESSQNICLHSKRVSGLIPMSLIMQYVVLRYVIESDEYAKSEILVMCR